MKLTTKEEALLQAYMEGITDHEEVLKMKSFIQHGDTSTYEHVLEVTRLAFLLSRRLPWSFHEKSVVKAPSCIIFIFMTGMCQTRTGGGFMAFTTTGLPIEMP